MRSVSAHMRVSVFVCSVVSAVCAVQWLICSSVLCRRGARRDSVPSLHSHSAFVNTRGRGGAGVETRIPAEETKEEEEDEECRLREYEGSNEEEEDDDDDEILLRIPRLTRDARVSVVRTEATLPRIDGAVESASSSFAFSFASAANNSKDEGDGSSVVVEEEE